MRLIPRGAHHHSPLHDHGAVSRTLLIIGVVFLALMLCSPRVAGSQSETTAPSGEALEAQVRQLSAELRCPVCQALSLADSPSELSQEMKDVVRAQLAAGRTPDEVKAYFVSRYGEWILLKPKARGWNLIVYALPVLAVVLGIGGVWYAVRRWSAAAAAEPIPEGAPLDAAGAPLDAAD